MSRHWIAPVFLKTFSKLESYLSRDYYLVLSNHDIVEHES